MIHLFRLIYASKASARVNEAAIFSLLSKSRRNNPKHGITGVLYYSGGVFVQVLEGPETAVLETYLRIKQDPLHHDTVILFAETCQTALFGDWSMGYLSDMDELQVDYDALLTLRTESDFTFVTTRCLQTLLGLNDDGDLTA